MKRYLLIIGFMMCFVGIKAQTVDTKIAVNSHTDDKTFVVIVSNENYKNEESVPFAKNDGEARAIVYYSGHGMPDESGKEAYLLPVDGFSQSTEGALSTKKLYEKLKEMPSKNIMVFLDACFSGAKRDGKMLASSRGVAIKVKADLVGDNTVVFSAAQGDETAYPYKSQKHGMFTYYVLEKMQQSGGYTTLGELSDYVTQQVKRKAVVENNGKSQTPMVIASNGNSNWRNWQFASVKANKYENRSVAASAPTPAPQPIPSAPRQNPVLVQKAPVQTTTPAMSNIIASDLVLEGKKAMRAMNYRKALKCLTQATEQGNIEANYQLGLLYSNSNYDGYNKEKAAKYFVNAANNNHMESMYQAGKMYLGTDNATAKEWFRKAAANGHSQAIKQLSRLR